MQFGFNKNSSTGEESNLIFDISSNGADVVINAKGILQHNNSHEFSFLKYSLSRTMLIDIVKGICNDLTESELDSIIKYANKRREALNTNEYKAEKKDADSDSELG